MHPEQKFSRRLIMMFPPNAHVQRIETSTGSGVPDINAVWQGQELWIETKVQTPGGHVLLRPYQWSWLNRRKVAGGFGYVIAQQHADPGLVLFWSFESVTVEQQGDYLRINSPHGLSRLNREFIELLFIR